MVILNLCFCHLFMELGLLLEVLLMAVLPADLPGPFYLAVVCCAILCHHPLSGTLFGEVLPQILLLSLFLEAGLLLQPVSFSWSFCSE